MPKRLIHHYAIASRRGGPHGFVAPDDFELSLRATSDHPTLPPTALAYCADMVRERVLFTCHTPADLPAMLACPFLFDGQLRFAGSVLSVPCERLDELGLVPAAAEPVFIFSAGRAGSTLLAHLLRAAGLPCASEPDMLTQLAFLSEEENRPMPPGMAMGMAGICIATLGRLLGRGVFLKLRSQCNLNPLMLLGAAGSGRVVFILRRADPWALSRHRAFNEGPDHVAKTLREAMDAFDVITRAGIPCELIWFEDMVRDPYAALRICAPHVRPQAAPIEAVMARDSQAGTQLASESLSSIRRPQAFLASFRAGWDGLCATTAWIEPTRHLVNDLFATP